MTCWRRGCGKNSGLQRAAGVTAAAGAVLASGTALAPAAAAPVPVWDRVAACESSSQWDIDTGNHYYGGLQFWQATWVHFGGQKYAPRADIATRQQQIQVARRVLAVQGPRAWPVCGKRAGLTVRNGRATTAPLPAIGPYVRTVAAPHRDRAHTTRHAAPRVHRYQVQRGDSLSTIAQRYGVRGGWQALWRYNRTNVPNPNVILVGQLLQIP